MRRSGGRGRAEGHRVNVRGLTVEGGGGHAVSGPRTRGPDGAAAVGVRGCQPDCMDDDGLPKRVAIDEVVDAIASVGVFASVGRQALRELAAASELLRLYAGQSVLRRGE